MIIAVFEVGEVAQHVEVADWPAIRREALGEESNILSDKRKRALQDRFGNMQPECALLKPRRILLITPDERVLVPEFKISWFDRNMSGSHDSQVAELNDEAANMIFQNVRLRATIGSESLQHWRSATSTRQLRVDFDKKGKRLVSYL